MHVREATAGDWAAIWPIFHEIVGAGDTYSYARDLAEDDARRLWMLGPPGRTVVAVDDDAIIGTAKMHPNQGGPGAHVATASFMVDPKRTGRGVGRALGENVIESARRAGYRALQFNAVVETNTRAVALWQSLGLEVLATIPEAFDHPQHGYVGMHVMHRRL